MSYQNQKPIKVHSVKHVDCCWVLVI